MSYRAMVADKDGNDLELLYYTGGNLPVIKPVMRRGVNRAGSFEFEIYPNHPAYDRILRMRSTIQIFEDHNPIPCFECRPISCTVRLGGVVSWVCEGALGYLNDSCVWFKDYENTTLRSYFEAKLANHNGYVSDQRHIKAGIVTVESLQTSWQDKEVVSALSCLQKQLVDNYGGYFIIRYSSATGGAITVQKSLDYLSELPRLSQSIRVGINLLDMERVQETGDELITRLIPLGGLSESTGLPITITSVNGGSGSVASAEGCNLYGDIWGTHTWPDIKDPEKLKAVGERYIQRLFDSPEAITIKAADLYLIGAASDSLSFGYQVYVENSRDGFSGWLDIVEDEIHLDNPLDNKYTIGRKRSTLSTDPMEVRSQNYYG